MFLPLQIGIDVSPIIERLNRIMATQAELAQALTALKAQADKAKAEIVAKLAALQTAIDNAGTSTPEVDAALKAAQASVQDLDNLNPDADPNKPADPAKPVGGSHIDGGTP